MAGLTLTQRQTVDQARAKTIAEVRELVMDRIRICCGYNSVGNDEAKQHLRAVLRKLEELAK